MESAEKPPQSKEFKADKKTPTEKTATNAIKDEHILIENNVNITFKQLIAKNLIMVFFFIQSFSFLRKGSEDMDWWRHKSLCNLQHERNYFEIGQHIKQGWFLNEYETKIIKY